MQTSSSAGERPQERGQIDLTVELSDWSMSVRKQRQVERSLTPLLAELFNIPPEGHDGLNIRAYRHDGL